MNYCRECGMPMEECWSNLDDFYLCCTWCGFERQHLGGRKVLAHGDPDKIAEAKAAVQKGNDRGAIASAYRQGYRDGMKEGLKKARGEK